MVTRTLQEVFSTEGINSEFAFYGSARGGFHHENIRLQRKGKARNLGHLFFVIWYFRD